MRITCTTLWLPKKGNTNDEYEDAAAPFDPVEQELEQFRCAIADGATETSFSALWAKLLVDGYVNGVKRDELKDTWQKSLENKQLAWYAEQKAESGAFAALLGLTIINNGEARGTWEAEAVGDCCLVLVRDEKFAETFPLTESEQFNNSPVLLSSTSENGADTGEECLVTRSGNWRRGDVFYLMTDAIARWAYKRQEEYGDAAFWLKSMKEQKDIEDFAAVQRGLMDAESRPLLRNDDVTLMRVLVE